MIAIVKVVNDVAAAMMPILITGHLLKREYHRILPPLNILQKTGILFLR